MLPFQPLFHHYQLRQYKQNPGNLPATFSACFGAAFLVWHPGKYAEMLAEKMKKHGAKAWLVNTGWSGGSYGVGSRISLRATRAIIDAINSNQLDGVTTVEDPIFGFQIPVSCPNVPESILQPKKTWAKPDAYDQKAKELAHLFRKNFTAYESGVSEAVKNAEPKV